MKRFVTDVNVIFSVLISGRESYLRMFTDFELFLPDFALSEIQEHQTTILARTKVAPEAFRELTLRVFSFITIVPNLLISNRSYLAAYQLCRSIDEDDTPYLAACIELDLTLISKDDTLVDGLRANGYSKVLKLSEFFELMERGEI